MSVTCSVEGTLTVTPPLPLAALWEFIDRPHSPFILATTANASGARGEWLLLPPEGCALDAAGRPTHVATLKVDVYARRSETHDRLRQFAQLCLTLGHDWVEEVRYQNEDLSRGVIEFCDDGELDWLE
ncbi:hypothetical protein SLUN_00085 [Streptomyces lunaelactis]|uniref:Uncharacterized protein n=1 Tax=Streptomyces lunaelactis TaxID=1535768 RepID=A0A2R4SVJ8_9ACTN|nr:hypothetical protein [Streptomyces lunaelactis]AVZ70903.1 hypothetical protein SLUN_00085 [Streptomyces lunaelactis]NUK26913.1 hypothetical protein [Streptomyces lunaelactis]NUK85630.1 hypothetical protein [Streptomyces lunaelactis]